MLFIKSLTLPLDYYLLFIDPSILQTTLVIFIIFTQPMVWFGNYTNIQLSEKEEKTGVGLLAAFEVLRIAR